MTDSLTHIIDALILYAFEIGILTTYACPGWKRKKKMKLIHQIALFFYLALLPLRP